MLFNIVATDVRAQVIAIVGFLGGAKAEEQPSFLEYVGSPWKYIYWIQSNGCRALNNVCTIRGILVGSRLQFEDMNSRIDSDFCLLNMEAYALIEAIEANDIHPVVDKKVFNLEQAKEAYQYQWDQKHFGKLCIKID
jgi:hypothetical protein